jgi:hypothetical protein
LISFEQAISMPEFCEESKDCFSFKFKWLLSSMSRFCDENLTKMGSGRQNVDLNRVD